MVKQNHNSTQRKGGDELLSEKVRGEEYRSTTVCIDAYQSGVPIGRFYNPSSKNGIAFHGITSFLLEMEQLLDRMELPKSFTAPRTFAIPSPQDSEPPPEQPPQGSLATFRLRILFRQNASWQGSVTWVEGRQAQSFRSVLELMKLIHSALEYRQTA